MSQDFVVIYGINGQPIQNSIVSSVNVEYSGFDNERTAGSKLEDIMMAVLKRHRLCKLQPELYSLNDIALRSICNI